MTLWQVKRAAGEVSAARNLLQSLKMRLLANDLLVTLPQIQRLEEEIAAAIKSGSQERLEVRVIDFARIAPEAAVLLEGHDGGRVGGVELGKQLSDAGQAAIKVIGELRKGDVNDLRRAAKPLTQLLVPLVADVTRFVARLKRSAEEEMPSAGK